MKLIPAILAVVLGNAFAAAQQTNSSQLSTGIPAPTLFGTVPAPSSPYICGQNIQNVVYRNTAAPVGQKNWQCTLASDGVTWAWVQDMTPGVLGTIITKTGLTASSGTQTICPADATCAAGFYHLDVDIVVTSGATLATLNSVLLTFTDAAGTTSVNMASLVSNACPSLSLAAVTRCSAGMNFKKTANTAVTLAVNITGTPTYNFDAVLLQNF